MATTAERKLQESRIIRLATLGALSSEAIAAELSLPVKLVKRTLKRHSARLDSYNHEIDRHLTNTQLASFTEARRIIFESLPEAAARLADNVRSNDPKVSLAAIDLAFKSSGLSEPPASTVEASPKHALSSIHIERALVALQSGPAPASLPTGLPSDHPLAIAARGAVSPSPSPPPEPTGNPSLEMAPLQSSSDPLPEGRDLPTKRLPPGGSSEPRRVIPILEP